MNSWKAGVIPRFRGTPRPKAVTLLEAMAIDYKIQADRVDEVLFQQILKVIEENKRLKKGFVGITGRYEVTTSVHCNCEGKELMKHEVIHFNPEPSAEPIHTYYCDWCGGDCEIDDSLLRKENGKYKKQYKIYT